MTSNKSKKKVVLGFLGTKLDGGSSDKRKERWRPSVAIFGHAQEFPVDRLELLLTKPENDILAQTVTTDIAELSPAAYVATHMLNIADPWDFQQTYAALHDFASAYVFRDDCEYFVHLTTGTHVAQICLFLLLESKHLPAKILETFSHGAPEGEGWKGSLQVIDLNLATYDQLAMRFEKESWDSQGLLKGGIETKNAAFNALIGRIEKVALCSTAPILLSGPTGAGKSQLGKRIFELRQRRHLVQGDFVEVNCATLRGDNAMSTLFGHKKGAFTGAVVDRMGMLKAADKGILFLDEIAELGLDEQAMLLRALEDKRFRPLGSDKEVSSDFQLLAGTNQDLPQRVAAGLFRADLLARINLWDFTLPGLGDRTEDIAPNLAFETERVGRELGKHVTWNTQAHEKYMAYALTASWPGNFRDLGASVTRLATLAQGARITEDDVRDELQVLKRAAPLSVTGARAAPGMAHLVLSAEKLKTSDMFELGQLDVVLGIVARTSNMAEAGRTLFSASRLNKAKPNDSDRVRKYLAGWGLEHATVVKKLGNPAHA
jgi:transcriptional regulatory protein RtcR